MTREEYFESIKVAIQEHFPENGLGAWENERWQRVVNKMYDDFAAYTPEQQQKLIKSAGPEEPFWERVVMDAAYTYYMLT